MSNILTRDDILGADDLTREPVEVPEWGGTVFVRTMTGTERDEFETSMFVGLGKKRKENFANLRARMVALCAVNDKGERLFTYQDAEALGRKNAAALDKVFDAAQKLNGFREQDIEKLVENSDNGPDDASTLP